MFKIRIANLNIKINNIYEYVKEYCKDFIIGDDEECAVEVFSTMEKLEYEKQVTPESFPNEVYELTSIYREICDKVLKYDTIFIHASSIAYKNDALLFLALSGTGKSTHARMWKEVYGDKISYVNDDKPLLRKIDGKWMVCGTPWNGKHRRGENKMLPLKAICLIKRNETNFTKEITSMEILGKLFNQILIPKEKNALNKTLDLVSDLLSNSKLYEINCTPTHEAAIKAYEEIYK